jgi:formylglycine-generating enzyme required for sulfatase activity
MPVPARRRLRARQSALLAASLALAAALSACGREEPARAAPDAAAAAGQVTVQGDDRIAETLTWRRPAVTLDDERLDEARTRAAAALEGGRLFNDADSAIPLYLAILEQVPGDVPARQGLARATTALLAQGDAALADAGDDSAALRRAHQVASVARVIAPKDARVNAYLARVDQADRVWALNRRAEADIAAGRLGDSGGGALARLRDVLALVPGQARALQGLAAVESGLIRRAEEAGARADFDNATRWLAFAERVRPEENPTVADAHARIARMRAARIDQLRDEGLVALQQRDDADSLEHARRKLAELLRLAEPGNAAAAELQQRIERVTHYGLFQPGQRFTDAIGFGARGPEMVVVPHGGFRMGAAAEDPLGQDGERPQHYVRFDRGFALSRSEVTVAQFGHFVAATGYQPTASKRGWSMVYDPRSGNFVRRNGVDWRHGYDGRKADPAMPVLHVGARDADAYAAWLAEGSGRDYHVPSEAQFEYALRAGSQARYPWGDGMPPPRAGNVTGSKDRSSGGRRWHNAFEGYGDGYWGPAPVASFLPNAYGLHDMPGNVGEWVADCWHDGYRRAPADGAAWVNPGCRTRVMRGGSWASAPAQTRSAWRAPAETDTTNARIGFRVAREL